VILLLPLQDNGQFTAAEAAFLRANKPREAIEMYSHQQMWDAALRVSESHDAASVSSVLRQQADALVQEGRLTEAELVYVQVCKAHRHAQCVMGLLHIPTFAPTLCAFSPHLPLRSPVEHLGGEHL
jgi:hypothetical protein